MKKVTYIFILLCLILETHITFSQTQHNKTHIDSLRNIYINSSGREKLENYLELSRAYWEQDPSEAIQISFEALAHATNLDYYKEAAKAMYYLGCAYHVNNQYGLSLEYLHDAYRYSKTHNFSKINAETTLQLGIVYYQLDNFKKCYDLAQEAYDVFNKIEDQRGKIKSLNLIGLYFKSQNKHDLASGYLDEALKSAKALKDNKLISTILNDLGNYYADKGDILKAIKIYEEAVSYHQDNSQNYNVALFELNLAILYLKHNENDKAFDHLNKGYTIAKNIKSHRLYSKYYDFLSQYHKKEKNYSAALSAYQTAQAYKDSIIANQQSNKIIDLEVKQATRDKDIENESLREENQTKDGKILRQYIIGLSLLITLMISFFILFIRTRNNRKQREILQLEKSLANQHATEISKKNKALHKSEGELKTANETKDKMFSLIAHDLRGSVGNISNGLRMLIGEEDLDFSEEEKKEFLGSLFHSANNSYELLENLLAWARNQSHSIIPNLELVNLEPIILSNMELLSELGKIKSIKTFTSTDNKIDIFCDRNMIQTVLRNFISNAIKFTNKNGIIEIRTEVREHFVSVSIIDNGVGMRKDQIQNIHKGLTTDGTANEKGTGIGLALCRDFLSKNHSWFNVISEVDKGSTFTFTVPRQPLSEKEFKELVKKEASYSLLNL
ncbi:tetratricopeptide repeat-containing sensor histidine kinase [Ancylomarina sp. 16SWW S1-10-2]|uniref:tetratricopeptide repeat-containing sensor histidine kinase n=1 Tax=Ancylomarina sp. 16SWW S1-10-2 TaxID=2499681 RepID=UPI0012ADA839|nr:sensor histidine kinase [Ancylomarina sp. 16SWW S1-10-2]